MLTNMQFSDAARLLSFYQLWLDELFPKAKFLDALAMVEKAGHGKSMAVLRKQWIDEGKPRTHMDDGEDELPTAGAGGETQRNGQAGETEEATRLAPVFEMARTQKAKTPTRETDPFASDEDIYDATPRRPAAGGGQVIEADLQGNDAPPDDDLEALMAETDIQPAPTSLFSGSIFGGPRPAVGTAKERPNVPDDDDEDLEALLAEEEAQRSSATGQAGTASVRSSIFGGDEHAQAAGAESVVDKALKPTSVTETHADDGIGAEEEEAMGEMDGLW
jgi:replication fork protection complex subunit Csm3/Swi3